MGMIVYLLLLHSSLTLNITSVFLGTPAENLTAYSKGSISSQFNDNGRKYNCALPNIFVYEQTQQQLQSNTPYNLTILAQGTYNISYTTRFNNFVPQITPTSCSGNCVVNITNNCPNPFSSYNYFDEINLSIGNLPTISYKVDCQDSFVPIVFQWGLFVLIILVTALMFSASYLSRCQSFNGVGVALGFKMLVGMTVLILVGSLIGAFFITVANGIVEVISSILGTLCVGLCCNEILWMLSIPCLNKPLFNINSPLFKYIRPI